jgi:hypothetical protein
MALFGSDKRKLDDAAADDNKKRIFKELGASDFADLAAYYSTLKALPANWPAQRVGRSLNDSSEFPFPSDIRLLISFTHLTQRCDN